MAEFTDREKAAALDGLVRAFCQEYWDFQGDGWVVLDGSVKVPPDAARVLQSMFESARIEVDPEFRQHLERHTP